MTVRTTITQEVFVETITEDFGPTLDKYGYERGYRLNITKRTYTEEPSSVCSWSCSPGTYFDMTMQPLRRRPGGEWESYQAYTPVRAKHSTQIEARNYGYATMIKARARLAKMAAARAA